MNNITALLKKHYLFVALLLGTATTLWYWLVQYSDIGFLQLHSIDEYVFHGSLRHMYLSALAGNIAGIFGYGFYQYGFGYFFSNLVVSVPFLLSGYTPGALIAPRVISAISAILAVVYIYRISLLYLRHTHSALLCIFVIFMPAFWYNATWFHPDWTMALFVIMSVYHLNKDQFGFKKHFWIGVLWYGIAVAVKYQAITFSPLIGLYVLYSLISDSRRSAIIAKAKILIISGTIVIGIFVISNPYILHPMGWTVFSNSFVGNMESNQSNHGKIANVPLSEKISTAISDYYYSEPLLLLVIAISMIAIVSYGRRQQRSLLPVLGCTFLLNIGYLLFFVNKAWQMYYLAPMMLSVVIIIIGLSHLSKRAISLILAILLLVQSIVYLPQIPILLSTSRDASVPDFNSYGVAENKALNEFIITALRPHIQSTSTVMITAYTPFAYESLGLTYEQVRIIFATITDAGIDENVYIESQRNYWGDLKTDEELRSSFIPIEFIVLRKDVPFIDTSRLSTIRDTEPYEKGNDIVKKLYDGTYPYSRIAENEYVVIFKSHD
jgi:hypothetical protein